ncbi:hypothetical protein [Kitasatospora sp. GAS1066B]|uniref:hypothetical protein n=1 Tax=Kitasatospora sp. GAS1066B TaxID=3156271 RepID=UPI0035156991
MAGDYHVDLQALTEAASGVNETLDRTCVQKVSDIPHDESAIGHHALASTLSDFLDRWQRGVDNLAKDGEEIATRLTANVKAYRNADQAVYGQLNQILTGNNDPGEK